MKKIWLLCLCLVCLGLVGCFHVPDEDWLPSKNTVNTGDIHRDEEMEQVLDSLIYGIDIISSEWNNMKNDRISTDGSNENYIEVEDKLINDEEAVDNVEITDNEVENVEIEENILPEE